MVIQSANWTFYPVVDVPDQAIDAWQELNRTAAGAHAALDYRFVNGLVQYFGDGTEYLALFQENGVCAAGTVIVPEGKGIWRMFCPGQACLGTMLVSPATDVGRALRALMSAIPGRCWLLRMPKMDPLCQSVDKISAMAGAECSGYGITFSVDVQNGFSEYWSSRSKSLRRNLRKAHESIDKAGLALEFGYFRDVYSVADCVRIHGELESSGWKGAAGSAVDAGNEQGAFYRELLEQYAHDGGAFMVQMLFDNEPVASLLCVEQEGVMIVLKTAFQEKFSKLAPGRVLDYGFLEYCNELPELNIVDMYTRASRADLSWATATRQIVDINLYRFAIFKAIVRAGKIVKRRLAGFLRRDVQ